MQGSLFLTVSLTRGVVALVGDPYKGIKKRSPQIFATGLAKGATGLLASPIVGALGFTSKLCDGVKATTHMLEISVVESRCRPERYLYYGLLNECMIAYTQYGQRLNRLFFSFHNYHRTELRHGVAVSVALVSLILRQLE